MKTAVLLTFSFLLSLSVCVAQEIRPSQPDRVAQLQTQVDETTMSVNELVERLRAAKASKTSSVQEVELLMKQLTQAVSDSFALQTKLQLAQLAEAEAKIAASRQLITERQQHADDIVGKRLQDLLNVPADAERPQTVLDAMERFTAAKDYDGLISLMTDDEADRMAGMLMHSMSMMSATLALIEGANDTINDSAQIRSIIANGDRFKRPNPSPDAIAALRQVTSILPSTFYQLGATSNGKPLERPNLTAEEYASLLRKASGVLTDTRSYSAEMMKAASALGADSDGEAIKSEWKIEVDGIRATATQIAQPIDRTTNNTAKVELQVEDGLWKISKLGSDEEMMQVLAGPNLASANPKAPPVSAQHSASTAPLPVTVPYSVSSHDGNLGGPPPLESKEEILPEWKDFLELLPETGTALVMFSYEPETKEQMLPVAKKVAEAASAQFIELPQSTWRKVIAPPATHFVVMKDRQLVGTRSGLLTESRMLDFVSVAKDWLTPRSTGVDEKSLVRIDCYISPGTNNIGSQYGGAYPLTTAVVAVHDDQALLLGPDSIGEYIEKGYACVAVVRDASGKQQQVPLDIVRTGPVPLLARDADTKMLMAKASVTLGDGQTTEIPLDLKGIYPRSATEPLDAYDTGSAIYQIRGAHGLTAVHLAAVDYKPQVDQRVLSGSFTREKQFPPIRDFRSPIQWQSQRIQKVNASIYGGNLNGPALIDVLCPTRPAPNGFTFDKHGQLIGRYALGNPSDKDMTHSVFQPYTTYSVLHAALAKIEDVGLKASLAKILDESTVTSSTHSETETNQFLPK